MVKHEGATIVISGAGARRASRRRPNASGTAPGHRLAAQLRKQYREEALAFAPQHRRTRSLRDWADNPLENQ